MSLPTAHCVALRLFFFFWRPKIVEVFPLKPAPFCELFPGLGNTNKFVTSLLSDCRSILCTLSSFPSFLLPQIFWWICPVFFTIRGYNGSRDILSSGERRGWELARRDAILVSSAVSCSPFAFTSLMQSLFLAWGHTVSSQLLNTQVISDSSTEEVVLSRHARCVFTCLRCSRYILLNFFVCRICRIENPSCSA